MHNDLSKKLITCFKKNTVSINELANDEFTRLLTDVAEIIGLTFAADMTKHKTLAKYCQHYALPETYGDSLREVFEQQIIRHVRISALLQYQYMQKTQEWGDLGEQRITLSYCRHALNLANDVELTQVDVDRFERFISEESQDIIGLSVEELRQRDEEIRCNIFYKEIDYSKEKDIHALLHFLGSTKGLICGQLSIFRSIIFGEAEIKELNGYRITTFKKELARTPAAVLSIAAVVGGKHIAIRVASCETIYANKWQGIMRQSPHTLFFDLLHEYENVSTAFKLKALHAYGVKTQEDMTKTRQLILDEMVEGLLWHELGHGMVVNGRLSVEDSAFGEALGVWGANVISVMKEIVADWAPHNGEIKGPLYFMAHTDKSKLTRMLYVYLSDNWFLGVQEDAFANHTEIMLALILKYISADGSVNQHSLQKAFSGETIFEYVLTEYMRITKYIEEKIKALPDFAQLQQNYIQRVRTIDKENPEDSLEFLVLFWAKFLEDMPKFNPQLMLELQTYLEAENKRFHEYLVTGYSAAAPQSLRTFVLEQLRAKGFYINYDELSAHIPVEDLLQKMG